MAAGAPRLRIVTLNCATTEACVADLERVAPDVVLLQEAPGEAGLSRMAQRLFGAKGSYLSSGDMAILARRLLVGERVERGTPFVVGSVALEDGRRLQCVSLRLAPPVARLDFWRRGFWVEHRARRAEHRRELQRVMAALDARRPTAIGGDFNTTPLDPALDTLRPQFTDAYPRCGVGGGETGPNGYPLLSVDQIWTNAGLVPQWVAAVRTACSDHRLVVCDVVAAAPGSGR